MMDNNNTSGTATPDRSNIYHPYTTPQHILSSASTSTPLPATPASDYTGVYSSNYSLPLPHVASSASTPYNGFITADTLDDVFGTTAATPSATFSLDTNLDMMDTMDSDMHMDLARLRAATHADNDATLPQLAPSPLPQMGRVASLGLSSLNIDGSEDLPNEIDMSGQDDVDDLFGDVYGGDATMSSGYTYPDPVSYAAMPPVSAVSAPATATAMPFTLPMPRTPLSQSQSLSLSLPQSLPQPQPFQAAAAPKPDTNDWRARLRFCEQAPNKALLEASMVRLLEFTDTMDERELAERRAANLRFDKIREQRLKDRNNEAAKRSRQRKVARIEAAELQIASLRRERAQLVGEVATLRRRLASTGTAAAAAAATTTTTTTAETNGGRKLRPARSVARLGRREE